MKLHNCLLRIFVMLNNENYAQNKGNSKGKGCDIRSFIQ